MRERWDQCSLHARTLATSLDVTGSGLPSTADQNYHPTTVTSCRMRIGQLVLSVAFAGLAIWSLAEGDHLQGALYLAISAAWLLIAAFKDRLVATRKRQRARLRS